MLRFVQTTAVLFGLFCSLVNATLEAIGASDFAARCVAKAVKKSFGSLLLIISILLSLIQIWQRCNNQAALARLRNPETYHRRKFRKIVERAVAETEYPVECYAIADRKEESVIRRVAEDVRRQLRKCGNPAHDSEEFEGAFVAVAQTLTVEDLAAMKQEVKR